MKLNGKKIEPRVETIVFPPDRVFKVKAILDDSKFLEICPTPKPPMVVHRDAETAVPDYNNKKYIKALDEHSNKRTLWMLIESLSDTPGLEWETVEMTDPTTWESFYTELRESGLTVYEQSKLIQAITNVNIVTDEAIKQATKDFLALTSDQA